MQLTGQPLCQDCGARDRVTAATEVHHVVAIKAGGTHSRDNLRSLCKPCHSKRTAREGGFGRIHSNNNTT